MKSAAALLFLFGMALPSQPGAVVEGIVTDGLTHAPLAGVNVTLQLLEEEQKAESYTATTDASGSFRIVGPRPGEYVLIYERDGFWTQIEAGIRVAAGATAHADMELSTLGVLRGRVLDPEGKPVRNAHLLLTGFLDREDASVKIGAFDDEQGTDAEGRFEITDLPPGSYSLRASMKKSAASAKTELSAGRTEVVPTYFPSAINLADAELIQIRPGANLGGYDIHLRISPVYRVRGIVLDESGKPIPKAEVALLGPGESRVLTHRLMFGPQAPLGYFISQRGQQDVEATAISANDGSFEFPSVRPGDWSLRAHRPNAPRFLDGSGVQVTISDRDANGIELRITPPFSLDVASDWGGKQPPPPNAIPPAILLSQKDSPSVISPENGLKPVLSPGQYRIIPVPARSPGFYPAAVMLGGRDVTGQDVELSSTAATIQIVYKPNPGMVRGTVDEGEGSTVLLWPLGTSVPTLVPSVRAGEHGAFEFSNVTPGDYSVIAFGRVPPEGAPESFASTIALRGKQVSVQEGSVESVQIAVNPWVQ